MKSAGFLIVLTFLVFTSCGKRVTQEQLIQEAVELKLSQWRLSELESCRDRAMAKAEAYVIPFCWSTASIQKWIPFLSPQADQASEANFQEKNRIV
jgi:hypothetical protein